MQKHFSSSEVAFMFTGIVELSKIIPQNLI